MKHTILIALAALFSFSLFGCFSKDGFNNDVINLKAKGNSIETNFEGDASYATGMDLGLMLKTNGVIPEMNEFLLGFMSIMYEEETRLPKDDYWSIIQGGLDGIREKRNEETKKVQDDFLLENSKNPGIIITESGLQYEIIEEGDGEKPTAPSNVKVNYRGTLIDGTEFDSSYEREEPFTFSLEGGVIEGWLEGVPLMSVGSHYRFYIPSDLAYGEMGSPNIPPYSTLIFDIELLEIME